MSLAQIYGALTYYYDHKDQFDRDIEEGEQFAEQIRPMLENAQVRATLQEAKRKASGHS